MSASEFSRTDFLNLMYVSHHGWLVGWLRNKLGCPDFAADLAQDTFLRVMLAREYENIREPRAYLTTIAHGLVVNHWRRLDIERAYLEALACQPEPLVPSPEQRALILETLYEIDALLGALSPQVKSAFLLSQIEGLKYEDIARLIGVSLITVKRYMKQAFLHCLASMD
ncbi:RNA polymerase [Methylocaldum marinum]|uniref:RNA polymerase n=1 Tax=Methylocaldum marinum TaxID=1432792 RepID=A0A250KWD4_9GAMM|nr:sigma-70 family RNA polymerase sigma factor [Methylocaldum marinum]BBA35814.1 RNA polymerase [Methylocaldum marinum]